MDQLSRIKVNNRNIRVAGIKRDYVLNVIRCAKACPSINKVILFGSALDTRCRKESDIDIAVFGNKSRYTFLRSGEYRIFSDAVYGFGNMQEYDILYFQSGKEGKHDILEDIHRGVVIYQKGD